MKENEERQKYFAKVSSFGVVGKFDLTSNDEVEIILAESTLAEYAVRPKNQPDGAVKKVPHYLLRFAPEVKQALSAHFKAAKAP